MPRLLYGTWRLDDQTELGVWNAVQKGFQGIDTACFPEEYNETNVGKALNQLFSEGVVSREDLFIQTKIDPGYASQMSMSFKIDVQVQLSIGNSMKNLGVDYIDSVLLNRPYPDFGDTMAAWRE